MTAFSELLEGLKGQGFEGDQLQSLFGGLPITSQTLQMMLPSLLGDQFDPLFPIELVEKDLGYAQELLADSQVPDFMVNASRQAFKTAIENGEAGKNITGVVQIYRKNT